MNFLIACIIYVMRSLFRLLNWEDGFLISLSSRYTLCKLSTKMYVSVVNVLVCSTTRSKAYNSDMRIFG